MDVTLMRITPALLSKVTADYPQFRFVVGSVEHWDAKTTITYTEQSAPSHLLHELAHALLQHTTYPLDIDLLRIERSAWDYARHTLAPRYNLTIDQGDAEDALDTYRDWLHNRSLCPDCGSSGVQNSDRSYTCVACRSQWRANEAKTCALRRRRLAYR